MEYVYPANFSPNEDGTYTISYPDLPGCISEGKSLGNAMLMAQVALAEYMQFLADKGREIPRPSALQDISPEEDGDFVNLVRAETKDGGSVRRSISIPKWMDEKINEKGISLSRVTQDALIKILVP